MLYGKASNVSSDATYKFATSGECLPRVSRLELCLWDSLNRLLSGFQ